LPIVVYYADFASDYLAILPDNRNGDGSSFVITSFTYTQNITICLADVNKKDSPEESLYEKEGMNDRNETVNEKMK
jgi:hypothetical protein